MRRALRDAHVNAAFVRGIGGMGKSSLAAKLIERPGVELDGVLVIRCHEVDPLDIPAKLAQLPGRAGRGRTTPKPPDCCSTASLTPGPARPPGVPPRSASGAIVLVFDNFESR